MLTGSVAFDSAGVSHPSALKDGASSYLLYYSGTDGTVSKIDATTLVPSGAIPVAGAPAALAFGGGGLWVGLEFGQRVVRIDTRTGRETAVLRVKGHVAPALEPRKVLAQVECSLSRKWKARVDVAERAGKPA